MMEDVEVMDKAAQNQQTETDVAVNGSLKGGARPTRLVNLTEKCHSYAQEIQHSKRKLAYKSLQNQLTLLADVSKSTQRSSVLEIELSHLDEKFRALATIQNDYLALLEPGNQYDLEVEWFTRINKAVFTVSGSSVPT